MSRLGEIGYRIAFIGRWYFWYNLELTLLHATVPKGMPIWSTRDMAERSRALDGRRRSAQSAIFAHIRGYGAVCAACGACCRERVDRFTAFDAAVRVAGPMPLDRFGRDILSLPWIVFNGLKHTGERAGNALLRRRGAARPVCENLGLSGCTLTHEERPMLCASWFCPKYLLHMSIEDLRGMGPKLREMERIHFESARLLRSNVATPRI